MLSPFGPRQIDLGNPVAGHPLNYGRVLWLYGLSNNSGGRTWFDLRGAYPGTLTNGPTWEATGRGDAGLLCSAAAAAGAGSGAALPSAFALPATGDFTAAAWFRTSTAAEQVILSNNNGQSGRFDFKAASLSSGTYRLFVFLNSGASLTLFGATATNDGLWHRGALTRAANTWTLYLDGRADGTTTNGGSVNTTTAFRVGLRPMTQQGLTGAVADVGVWTRALSADEVWSDYVWSRGGYRSGGPLRRTTPVVYSFGPPPVVTGGWGPLVGGYRNQRVVRV